MPRSPCPHACNLDQSGAAKDVLFVTDHPPPHFHALFGEHRARVAISYRDIAPSRAKGSANRLTDPLAPAGHHREVILEHHLPSSTSVRRGMRRVRANHPGGKASFARPEFA